MLDPMQGAQISGDSFHRSLCPSSLPAPMRREKKHTCPMATSVPQANPPERLPSGSSVQLSPPQHIQARWGLELLSLCKAAGSTALHSTHDTFMHVGSKKAAGVMSGGPSKWPSAPQPASCVGLRKGLPSVSPITTRFPAPQGPPSHPPAPNPAAFLLSTGQNTSNPAADRRDPSESHTGQSNTGIWLHYKRRICSKRQKTSGKVFAILQKSSHGPGFRNGIPPLTATVKCFKEHANSFMFATHPALPPPPLEIATAPLCRKGLPRSAALSVALLCSAAPGLHRTFFPILPHLQFRRKAASPCSFVFGSNTVCWAPPRQSVLTALLFQEQTHFPVTQHFSRKSPSKGSTKFFFTCKASAKPSTLHANSLT